MEQNLEGVFKALLPQIEPQEGLVEVKRLGVFFDALPVELLRLFEGADLFQELAVFQDDVQGIRGQLVGLGVGLFGLVEIPLFPVKTPQLEPQVGIVWDFLGDSLQGLDGLVNVLLAEIEGGQDREGLLVFGILL